MKRLLVAGFSGALLALVCRGQAARPSGTFSPVQPVTAQRGTSSAAAPTLQIGSGQFFSFAMPQGWRVGEDGQFALTLVASDNKAFTVMVGNAGLPPNYPPARFVFDKLSALRAQNLQIGQGRAARPVAGFAQAAEFDVSYSANGANFRGVAKCSVQPAYDTAVMAVTAALSEVGQWPAYASWLPQVADQVSATNGAAFGARGVMAQNLRNSEAFAEAARSYRENSERNRRDVAAARDASQAKTQAGMRDILGGTEVYADPWGNKTVEMPLTYRYYWVDQQGNKVGTDDPSANPNVGSTTKWRAMKKNQ
ncbi:MAG: hypothetical protein ABI995_00980 [Acidobacteriota bacterium]